MVSMNPYRVLRPASLRALFCFLYILWGGGFILYAQELSPEEAADIQNELKIMRKDPVILRDLKDRAQLWDATQAQKAQDLDSLKNYFDSLADSLVWTNNREDSLKPEYYALLNETRNARLNIVFRIQIGIYRQHPLDRYRSAGPAFFIDRSPQGFKRYMIGFFRNYWEARNFDKWIKRWGAKSYVVGYRDNIRARLLTQLVDFE